MSEGQKKSKNAETSEHSLGDIDIRKQRRTEGRNKRNAGVYSVVGMKINEKIC